MRHSYQPIAYQDGICSHSAEAYQELGKMDPLVLYHFYELVHDRKSYPAMGKGLRKVILRRLVSSRLLSRAKVQGGFQRGWQRLQHYYGFRPGSLSMGHYLEPRYAKG